VLARKIAPCLWFDGNAEEAAEFYAGVFPDSHIGKIHRAPGGKAAHAMTVEFTVLGMAFVGLNGGPMFHFNEAVSFQVYTEDQAETDRLWNAIIADGGSAGQCGWCKDRFGLSWQVVPRRLMELMGGEDGERAKRAMSAMVTMTKIDIASIERVAG
jgi:predicted 3-demethylubiquinone-9 3-methyltransferase (glyoxalase superfamily)